MVSIKCDSTDFSTNISSKCVSIDISNECVCTEYISIDISMKSVSIDTSTSLFTKSVFKDTSTHVSTKFFYTNISTGVSTDNNAIRYTSIFTNVFIRKFMDVPIIVINDTSYDIDNNNEYKEEDVLDKLIEKSGVDQDKKMN